MSNFTKAHALRGLSAMAVALLSAGSAWAGAASENAAESGLNDIVITAQRTSQRLQEVPVSVSAFGSEQMERLQINSAADLSRVAPNVKFDVASGGSGSLKAFIRGGGATDGAVVTSESEVAIYVDDVYRARHSGAMMDFVELERIEVLRGPQGVLYGRNSSAGAVKFVTRAPSDEFGGNIQLGYGEWNERRIRGYVTGGLSEDGKWRASVNAMVRGRDGGRQYNETLDKKVGAENFEGVQADLAYVGDNIKSRLTGFYTNNESDGIWAVNHVADGNGGWAPQSGSYYRVQSPVESKSWVEQWGATWNNSADFAGGQITSITSYIKQRDYWRVDFSGGVPDNNGVMRAMMDRSSLSGQHQVSQEFQVSGSALGGFVDYVGGIYYFHETADIDVNTLTFFAPTRTTFGTKTDSFAGYGQVTLNVTDQLSAIIAGRYTIDDKSISGVLNGNAFASKDSFQRFTPKFGLDFQITPDLLLFASYSEGYKSGGYSGLASTVSQISAAFKPQVTQAYEVGVKADLFHNNLRVNVSAFNNDIRDRQQLLGLGDGGFMFDNYDVRIRGVEAEVSWQVFTGLTLWLQGAINDGEYTAATSGALGGGALMDKAIAHLPDYQYTLGFDYRTDLGKGELSFGADYSLRDEYYSTAANELIGWVDKQDVLAAYIAYDLDNWSFRLSGKNLLNEEGWQTGFGFATVQPRFAIEPRSWMVTAKYKF